MNENDSVCEGAEGQVQVGPTRLCEGDEFCVFTVLTAENLNLLYSSKMRPGKFTGTDLHM